MINQLMQIFFRNSRYVALKVMTSKSTTTSATELSIFKRIGEAAPTDPMAKHVMALLDTFQHSGPNGTHRCFVFKPMGSTAASMLKKLPENKVKLFGKGVRYPKRMANLILKHTLLGLAFLHRNNIVHGDLQPGNLLFSIPDINSLSEEELKQDQSQGDQLTTPELLERLDGKEDKWAPRYLFLGQSLHEYVSTGPEMLVKISDFGAGRHPPLPLPWIERAEYCVAFWSNKPPQSTITPVALRAPELIFGEKFDSSVDIWSFGCLIYEFLTGTPLFCVSKIGNEDESADDDHLLELNDVLEPLPDSWLKEKWPRADRFFGPNRERLNPYSEENVGTEELDDTDSMEMDDAGTEEMDDTSTEEMDTEEMDNAETEELGEVQKDGEECDDGNEKMQDGSLINDPLEKLFEKNKPEDIDKAEAEVVTALIRQILKYEPSQRPSAMELLQHPWFQD